MEKYYIYSFNKFFGNDKIFYLESDNEFSPGDLYHKDGDYYLIIGKKVFKPKIYKHKKDLINTKDQILFKKLISTKTLDIISILVDKYFSTYRNILPLFIGNDIQKLIKHKIEKKSKPNYKQIEIGTNEIKSTEIINSGQCLIIFPDIWSYKNHNISTNENNSIFIHSKSTDSKKYKTFWNIKKGSLGVVFSTYSQIFQDWLDLKRIIIIDSHRWYYKSQQDPRYYIPSVIEIMAEIYGCNIEKHGIDLS